MTTQQTSGAAPVLDPAAAELLHLLAAGFRRKEAELTHRLKIETARRRREIEQAVEAHQSASDKGWQAGWGCGHRSRKAGRLAEAFEEILAEEGL